MFYLNVQPESKHFKYDILTPLHLHCQDIISSMPGVILKYDVSCLLNTALNLDELLRERDVCCMIICKSR